MEGKKARGSKTTREQFEIYLNELENNEYFRENKMAPDKPNILTDSWTQLVAKLNSSGGPSKDISAWKKTFADWKCQVRKRARVVKTSLLETGSCGAPEKPLTDLEKRLLYVTGRVVIDGLSGVPELGTQNESVQEGERYVAEPETQPEAQPETQPEKNKQNKHPQNVQLKPKNTLVGQIAAFSGCQEQELSKISGTLENINKNLEALVSVERQKLLCLQVKLHCEHGIEFPTETKKQNNNQPDIS